MRDLYKLSEAEVTEVLEDLPQETQKEIEASKRETQEVSLRAQQEVGGSRRKPSHSSEQACTCMRLTGNAADPKVICTPLSHLFSPACSAADGCGCGRQGADGPGEAGGGRP